MTEKEKELRESSANGSFCPYCGAELRLTGYFCSECGTRFKEMGGEVSIIVRQIIYQRIAQEIMGKNFFGIEEAIKHFKVNPTEKDLKDLAKIPFSEELLEKLKDTHILIAVFPLSILDIRSKVDSKLFDDSSWYNDEAFVKERGETGWQLIRKIPVPNSTSMIWSKQKKLIGKDEEVPCARVMVHTIIGHYLATGERLFKDIHVRTSSTALDGFNVYVGYFDSGGLIIYNYWDVSDYSYFLGVSSSRKL